MQIIGVLFFGLFTLISGPVADVIGRRRLLIWTTVAIIVFGLSFQLFLQPRGDLAFTGALTQAFLIFGFMLMGTTFGPMGALLPELFPTNVRYTGSAIAYNVASILGAAVAPIIAVALWATGRWRRLAGRGLPGRSRCADPDRAAAEQGDQGRRLRGSSRRTTRRGRRDSAATA